MEDAASETCTCGVHLHSIEAPTHPYMLSTPSCWEAYGRLLAKEYEAPSLMRLHRLTVDAYAAQHPGDSVGIHLSRLALMMDEGWVMERANDAMLSITAKKRQYPWLVPPKLDGAGTFLPALHAVGSDEHESAVSQWARGVWQAWTPHHAQVKSWLRDAGLII